MGLALKGFKSNKNDQFHSSQNPTLFTLSSKINLFKTCNTPEQFITCSEIQLDNVLQEKGAYIVLMELNINILTFVDVLGKS